MCTMVYLSSQKPLPTCAWDKDHPAFYVEALPPDSRDNSVCQHLTGPFVYRLGSHQYCGCGISYRYDSEWPDAAVFPDELDAAETRLDHAVHGIDTAPANADDLDDGQVVLRCAAHVGQPILVAMCLVTVDSQA